MFLCSDATPVLPNICIVSLQFFLATFAEGMIQEVASEAYSVMKESMSMFVYTLVILLGTTGRLQRAGLYGNQQDNTNNSRG